MVRRVVQVAAGLTAGLIVALIVLVRVGPGPEPPPPEGPVERAVLPDPFPAPPLDLVDPDGTSVGLEDFEGSLVAVFFGYTYCPDVCPLTLAVLGRLQEEEQRGGAPLDPPLEVVFVSVDPERDTPDRLRRFAAGLPGRIRTLTGEGDRVRAQAFTYGVDVQRPGAPEVIDPEGPVPDYRVDHTARTFLLDSDGRVVATLPAMVSAADARAVVERVRGLEAS
jgi:protein SCO1/2